MRHPYWNVEEVGPGYSGWRIFRFYCRSRKEAEDCVVAEGCRRELRIVQVRASGKNLIINPPTCNEPQVQTVASEPIAILTGDTYDQRFPFTPKGMKRNALGGWVAPKPGGYEREWGPLIGVGIYRC